MHSVQELQRKLDEIPQQSQSSSDDLVLIDIKPPIQLKPYSPRYPLRRKRNLNKMNRISPVIEPGNQTNTSWLPDIKNRESVVASTTSSSGTDLSKMRRINRRAILMLSTKMKINKNKPDVLTNFSAKFKANYLSPLSQNKKPFKF